eukprot:9156367-Alexandrium_andersonii.AAC.3
MARREGKERTPVVYHRPHIVRNNTGMCPPSCPTCNIKQPPSMQPGLRRSRVARQGHHGCGRRMHGGATPLLL